MRIALAHLRDLDVSAEHRAAVEVELEGFGGKDPGEQRNQGSDEE
jgi:hypothetical protein